MKGKLLFFVAVPLLAFIGAKLYLHIQVGKSVDAAFEAMAPFADVSYESVESTIDGNIGIRNLVIRPNELDDEVTVEHVSIKFPSMLYLFDLEGKFQKQEFPEELRIAVDGVTLDVTGELMNQLEESMFVDDPEAQLAAYANCVSRTSTLPTQQYLLGYTEISMSYAIGYRYSDAEDSLVLYGEISQADGMAMRLEMATAVNSLSILGLQQVMSDPELSTAYISLRDDGYFGRIYDFCAEENVLDREAVTDLLMAEFHDYFDDTPMRPNLRILEEYRKFLRQGGEFVMEANPRSPKKLADLSLYDPTDVPDLLNIQTAVR